MSKKALLVLVVVLAAAGFLWFQQKGNKSVRGTPDVTASPSAGTRPAGNPYRDIQGQYSIHVPDGWYPLRDGQIGPATVFTKRPNATLPPETEGYALGPQFSVSLEGLSDYTSAKTRDEWLTANAMTPESEFYKSSETVTRNGLEFVRVVLTAAAADGDVLIYAHFFDKDRVAVLSHYPSINGSRDSNDFEAVVASFELVN